MSIYDKVGIGFGFGGGTGTLGKISWTRDDVQTRTTKCICCDDEKPSPQDLAALQRALDYMRAERESPTANVLALTALGMATTLAILHPSFWLSHVFLWTECVLTVLSAVGVSFRRAARMFGVPMPPPPKERMSA